LLPRRHSGGVPDHISHQTVTIDFAITVARICSTESLPDDSESTLSLGTC